MFAARARQAPTPPPPTDLEAGFAAAMAFPLERARSLAQSREALAALAQEEVAFRVISVDAANLTAGTRLHVLEPARGVIAEWRQARAPFDRAIAPFMPAIDGVRAAEQRIATRQHEKDEALAQAERKLEQRHEYLRVRKHRDESRDRFAALRAAHANRDANLWSESVLYWLALFGIGGAEWLINYDVFESFMGIPALGAGTTIVMALLLAFAAHGHGTLLKQWSHRFGAERRSIERFGDWRMLGLATLSLLIVLVAAGGSRYAVVASGISAQVPGNLAGADAVVQFDPLRDVMLSLAANVAAWAAGVFIAFLAHDVDPDYADATLQERRWSRRYNRWRAATEDEKHTIDAQFEKQVRDLHATAATQAAAVRPQHELLVQVEKHEAAVLAAVAAQVATNAQTYHDALAQRVMALGGECRIRRGEEEMSAYAFKSLRPQTEPADLALMVG